MRPGNGNQRKRVGTVIQQQPKSVTGNQQPTGNNQSTVNNQMWGGGRA